LTNSFMFEMLCVCMQYSTHIFFPTLPKISLTLAMSMLLLLLIYGVIYYYPWPSYRECMPDPVKHGGTFCVVSTLRLTPTYLEFIQLYKLSLLFFVPLAYLLSCLLVAFRNYHQKK
jgi:hypothetical protein